MLGLCGEPEPMGEPKLELELYRRSECDVEKARELARSAPSASLRDVAADRDGGTTHLLTQAVPLVEWKLASNS